MCNSLIIEDLRMDEPLSQYPLVELVVLQPGDLVWLGEYTVQAHATNEGAIHIGESHGND